MRKILQVLTFSRISALEGVAIVSASEAMSDGQYLLGVLVIIATTFINIYLKGIANDKR